MNRRRFLKIVGGGGAILAAGGIGFVTTRTPTAALQPWLDAGSLYEDPMRRALSYAILAPNPHNRQPWLVELKSDTEAVLICDTGRLLPATDPFSRQIVIGLGCFLETFALAATDEGYRAEIDLFPQGVSESALDDRPVARLSLSSDSAEEPDPLFHQVLHRHTNREVHDIDRAIPGSILANLKQHASTGVTIGAVAEGARLGQLRSLVRDAMFGEMRTEPAHRESIDLMRIGRAEIEANPDGISLGGPFLEALNLAGVLTRQTLADPSSSAFQTGLDMFEEASMSSMGFVWINTDGNTRTDQIAAGRAYMRVCLQATADGVAVQPMSQALQEYPEMAEFYKAAHTWLADRPGERVQMLARVGYAKSVPAAPRWPLATRIKGA